MYNFQRVNMANIIIIIIVIYSHVYTQFSMLNNPFKLIMSIFPAIMLSGCHGDDPLFMRIQLDVHTSALNNQATIDK